MYKREVYERNWFMQLWRPKGATICKLENEETSGTVQSVPYEGRASGALGGASKCSGTSCSNVPRRESMDAPGQDGWWGYGFTLPPPLVLLRLQWSEWCRPTGVRADLLCSVYWFKCRCFLEIPSQTHPEIIFSQLSGHPFPVKLTHKINHHTGQKKSPCMPGQVASQRPGIGEKCPSFIVCLLYSPSLLYSFLGGLKESRDTPISISVPHCDMACDIQPEFNKYWLKWNELYNWVHKPPPPPGGPMCQRLAVASFQPQCLLLTSASILLTRLLSEAEFILVLSLVFPSCHQNIHSPTSEQDREVHKQIPISTEPSSFLDRDWGFCVGMCAWVWSVSVLSFFFFFQIIFYQLRYYSCPDFSSFALHAAPLLPQAITTPLFMSIGRA